MLLTREEQTYGFLRATTGAAELRIRRMGVLDRPLDAIPGAERSELRARLERSAPARLR